MTVALSACVLTACGSQEKSSSTDSKAKEAKVVKKVVMEEGIYRLHMQGTPDGQERIHQLGKNGLANIYDVKDNKIISHVAYQITTDGKKTHLALDYKNAKAEADSIYYFKNETFDFNTDKVERKN